MIDILKVLADENRLRILNILSTYELCVCEIEVILEMTQSNVSRHLNRLKSERLIESSKDAQWVHYKSSESFEKQNKNLYNYLIENFNSIDLFKNDLERCKIYKNSSYDCQDIRKDKEFVEKEIRRLSDGK